ncbi:MAG: RNA polymerase [Candidatus Tectimicrobiota bacterium]|nr:MAG: RNA polymerase [Candidatus Tectomicrobia bacterium]
MAEMAPPDAALLARIAQRDGQALELLYHRYGRQVFSLARAMLGDQAQAAELTQEVFLLVWCSAGTYRPTGSALAWLLRLTRNRAIDLLRRRRRQRRGQPRGNELPLAAGADAAEQRAVRDAVAALPPEQRQALWLAFFQGMSHQEIAAYLQIPLGTVKARIRRALQALRQRLQ